MLKDSRNLLWLFPLAALLTAPLWKPLAADFLNPAHPDSSPQIPSAISSGTLSSSEMTGVKFEQSKNGAREWLLTASRLASFENDSYMRLEDVEALFFGETEKNEETRIRSRQARYNADTRQITLLGEVVIQNTKGYEMLTESMVYLAAQKKIRATSSVRITGNNIGVRGNSLLYDTVTGDYILEGNVVCKLW